MQMIEHALKNRRLKEMRREMCERGEFVSYDEMIDEPHPRYGWEGNRRERRKAAAEARKSKVPA